MEAPKQIRYGYQLPAAAANPARLRKGQMHVTSNQNHNPANNSYPNRTNVKKDNLLKLNLSSC